MDAPIALSYRFDAYELPSYSRSHRAPPAAQREQVRLISDSLPAPAVLHIRSHRRAITQDEHNALHAALLDSVQVRAVLRRG